MQMIGLNCRGSLDFVASREYMVSTLSCTQQHEVTMFCHSYVPLECSALQLVGWHVQHLQFHLQL